MGKDSYPHTHIDERTTIQGLFWDNIFSPEIIEYIKKMLVNNKRKV